MSRSRTYSARRLYEESFRQKEDRPAYRYDPQEYQKKSPRAPIISDLDGNPMSPYELPKSHSKYYLDPEDVFVNLQFKAIYPESYGPIPDYYRRFGVDSYYEPIPGSDYSRGVLTIETMMELMLNDQPWALQDPRDMDIIINILNDYIEMCKNTTKKSSNGRAIKVLIRNLTRLRNIVEEGRLRATRRGDLKPKAGKLSSFLNKFR